MIRHHENAFAHAGREWQLSHTAAAISTIGYFLLITPARIDRKPEFRP
jgi:hypothetical protein